MSYAILLGLVQLIVSSYILWVFHKEKKERDDIQALIEYAELKINEQIQIKNEAVRMYEVLLNEKKTETRLH